MVIDGRLQKNFGGLKGCKAGIVDFQEHWSGGVNFDTARKQNQNTALEVEWQLIQESSTKFSFKTKVPKFYEKFTKKILASKNFLESTIEFSTLELGKA